jgi:hypothetical protein
MLKQANFEINNEKQSDASFEIQPKTGMIVKVGKRRIVKIIID